MAGGRENEGGESGSCGGSGVIQSLRRLVRVGELNISDWLLYGFILTLTLTLTQPFEWDLDLTITTMILIQENLFTLI